ncbi:MarR family winged helix-turn-helix transcriptional regulator [Actinomadura rupiterrae]|uniref:MarR family winged helix-turn-helix transcriptional regulator n=1 Tax=Actinomadura rupiterrae TaxID=559627 RepID=UPI0020A2E39F|nr:MarR family transcriptional regulator [Actinomadura rupiterrae]MCP2340386.1 DNA-binding MarR family transcriptional regulator [Actinomadura rupiterrae]
MRMRDTVDEHVERWLPLLPDLDPDVEGAITRVHKISGHLRRVRERALADGSLHLHEFDTLHALAGRHGQAAPSQLAADLGVAPNSVTGRLDGLAARGFVRRTPSETDRRRVVVELTDEGRAAWRGAMDAQGDEEHRIFAALTRDELRHLSDLLRRVVIRADTPDPDA